MRSCAHQKRPRVNLLWIYIRALTRRRFAGRGGQRKRQARVIISPSPVKTQREWNRWREKGRDRGCTLIPKSHLPPNYAHLKQTACSQVLRFLPDSQSGEAREKKIHQIRHLLGFWAASDWQLGSENIAGMIAFCNLPYSLSDVEAAKNATTAARIHNKGPLSI